LPLINVSQFPEANAVVTYMIFWQQHRKISNSMILMQKINKELVFKIDVYLNVLLAQSASFKIDVVAYLQSKI